MGGSRSGSKNAWTSGEAGRPDEDTAAMLPITSITCNCIYHMYVYIYIYML